MTIPQCKILSVQEKSDMFFYSGCKVIVDEINVSIKIDFGDKVTPLTKAEAMSFINSSNQKMDSGELDFKTCFQATAYEYITN